MQGLGVLHGVLAARVVCGEIEIEKKRRRDEKPNPDNQSVHERTSESLLM